MIILEEKLKNNNYLINLINNLIKVGFIDIFIDNKDKEIIIKYLKIEKKFRGNKYGIYLLDYVIKKSKKENIKRILLDDMSDKYRKPNNIYIKKKFKYVNNYGPEMILIIK